MDKLNRCYDIGTLIIDKYIELIGISIYTGASYDDIELIDEIRKLIIKEYNLYYSMSLDEISLYLDALSEQSLYKEPSTVSRMHDKLGNMKEILLGRCFSGDELGLNFSDVDMKFSVYDIMMSIINISAIKLLKNKIDSLIVTSNKDVNFVSSLYTRLEISKNELLLSLSTSEIIALCFNFNIDKIKNLSVSKINKLLLKFEGTDTYLNAAFYNASAVYMKSILDRLAVTYIVDNNPEEVFFYLSLITRIEVIISYMSKDTLNMIYNYCCTISNENNQNCIGHAKALIKNRISLFNDNSNNF